ncbi:formamidopyrimidine-DNA glycosylase [Murinocardiopsis flavida]|uniref:Formamidopyrimidine-DNA glycosylase n=1 Tax=Murinocardiopsis flavida TaxID=645275 RepID=A0A2P8D3C7_9ACTN|nr:DNA-formamidopyrimidine glycosylase family protein [Murinocardiopsis flavida]PSK91730.1 formamidopyrimidine-DNA glycosylase [Murinocardiopsis flavida]
MPELPELQVLAEFLGERAVGRVVARVDVLAVSVLKTYDPPVDALGGLTVTAVARRGKFLDFDVDGLHLIVHLARAGSLRWHERVSGRAPRPGKGPLGLRVSLDDGSGFDLAEAGTQKRMAVSVVRSPDDVEGIASLGPDPLDPGFDRAGFAALAAGRRTRIKGLLRDQKVIAGVGNAYSDEILHAARISPFAIAADLSAEQVDRLFEATRGVLSAAVERARGADPGSLAKEKRAGFRVHGRTGRQCPVCGDTIREVSYADSALQYCATCQTGGKALADRRMSRLLK